LIHLPCGFALFVLLELISALVPRGSPRLDWIPAVPPS